MVVITKTSYENDFCFSGPHLGVQPEVPPTDSPLHSQCGGSEAKEEEEEENLWVYEQERHFEVSAQQEQQLRWREEEGGRVSEGHILQCSSKAGKDNVLVPFDADNRWICFQRYPGYISDLRHKSLSCVSTFCVTASLLRVTDTPTVGCRSAGSFCFVRFGGLSTYAPSTAAALHSRSTEPTARAEREMFVLPRERLPQHKWIWEDTSTVL